MKKKFLLISFLAIIIVLSFSACGFKKQDPVLKEIKNRRKLIVGTFPQYQPFTFENEKKEIDGYDIELIKEIARRMGLEVEFKDIFFLDLFSACEKREIDVAISGITISSERLKNYLFSDPYINVGQVLVVKKENNEIKSKEDAMGKKIGATRGTTLEESAKKITDPSLVFVYDNLKEVSGLENGEVDALVRDYVEALSLIKTNPNLKIAGDPFVQDYYGIMTHKNNQALINEINNILGQMSRENELKKLRLKWLGE